MKSLIEEGLSRYFQYDAHVFIRDEEAIQEILAAAQSVRVPDECHHYTLLFDDSALFEMLEHLFDSMPHGPNEQLMRNSCGAFWIVPKGSTLDSDFGSKVLGGKQYKDRLTSRNINTIQKISRAIAG